MKRGRSIVVDWQDSAETLYKLYCEEDAPKKRQRLQFLWLLRTGNSLRESSRIAAISERSGQRYLKWYREGGVQELLGRQHGGHAPRQSYLTSEQEASLVEKSKEGNLKTVWDAVNWVKDRHKVSYTYSGMNSVLKRLKLNKKVPRPQHEKSDPTAQEAWKKGGLLND